MSKKKFSTDDIYRLVTDRICDQLKKGTVPWERQWKGREGWPKNALSEKSYRGVNVFILWAEADEAGFKDNRWCTFKQARQLGGHVRKGETSTTITFWKMLKFQDADTDEDVTIPMLRYYRVFNVEQCDGLDIESLTDETPKDFNAIDEAEKIVNEFEDAPEIKHNGRNPSYLPLQDIVHMPERVQFDNEHAYYGTLFHELSHSTGHDSRIDRNLSTSFGSNAYGKEELVAELGAAMLSAIAGIDIDNTIEHDAAYIAGWLKELRSDHKLIVNASSAAQKSSDWILGQRWGKDKTEEVAAPQTTFVEEIA